MAMRDVALSLFFCVLLSFHTVCSSDISHVRESEEEIVHSSRRELVDRHVYPNSATKMTLHDTMRDAFVPVTNPATTPAITVPSTNPASPGVGTMPPNNPNMGPVTIPPINPEPTPVTVPGANPMPTPVTTPIPATNPVMPTPGTTPAVPVTNPATTPTTFPGTLPVTDPTTTYTYPPQQGVTPVIAPPSTVPSTVPVTPTVSGQAWCVAKTGLMGTVLQDGLDYACGIGGADCSAIQPLGSCYNPNTVQAHASYAFNSYYQRNPTPASCDFGGAGMLVNTNPSSGTCMYQTQTSSLGGYGPVPTGAGSVSGSGSGAGSTVLNANNPGENSVYGSDNPAGMTSNSFSLSCGWVLSLICALVFAYITEKV